MVNNKATALHVAMTIMTMPAIIKIIGTRHGVHWNDRIQFQLQTWNWSWKWTWKWSLELVELINWTANSTHQIHYSKLVCMDLMIVFEGIILNMIIWHNCIIIIWWNTATYILKVYYNILLSWLIKVVNKFITIFYYQDLLR